jgi:outer membrane protein insertion porin family
MMRFHEAAALLFASGALAQHPIAEIHVEGNQRLTAAAVIGASGLRVGQITNQAGLNAAAQKLADTGFFTSVSYRYDPKAAGGVTGYALTLQITEETARVPVELDIPGLDGEALWRELKSSDPLIDRQMPNNSRAPVYYQRAIEAVLRKSNHAEAIVLKNETDLRTGQMAVVCRPASLFKIASIRFEGNAAITDRVLQAAMNKVAVGQDYSERDFRRELELNVRPLYEELGRLTAAFSRVSMAGAGGGYVVVTAAIDEGPVWRLGRIRLLGEALPLADIHDAVRFEQGSPANWRQVMASVEKMEQVLRRDGYIRVTAKPVRSFQDATHVVDVNVEVRKGPQFLFGELHIEGLDAAIQQRLASLWNIPAGAPMNQPYIDEFVHSAAPILRGKFRTFRSEMNVREHARIVDVTLKFQ